MNRRIATRGIIYKDGKIFAVRHKSKEGEVSEFWATPGGGLDPNESLSDGITRELIEETGVAPQIGTLLYIQQYTMDNGREELEFFYHIINADDYNEIDLASTSHGEIEIAEYGFIDPSTSAILPKFLNQTNIAQDIERGRTQLFSYL